MEELAGEDAEEGPGQVQRLEDVARVVRPLAHELPLELVQKLQVQLHRPPVIRQKMKIDYII